MGTFAKFRRLVGIAAVVTLAFLTFRAVRGRVMQESQRSASGPTIKVRMLAKTPWTIDGFLGFGDVIYRAEYYPSPGAGMSSSAIFSQDSLMAGDKIDVKWLGSGRAEAALDNDAIFHWTGTEWQK